MSQNAEKRNGKLYIWLKNNGLRFVAGGVLTDSFVPGIHIVIIAGGAHRFGSWLMAGTPWRIPQRAVFMCASYGFRYRWYIRSVADLPVRGRGDLVEL